MDPARFDTVEVQVVTFSMQQSQLALADVLASMPTRGDVIVLGIEQAEDAQVKTYLNKISPFMARAGYEFAHSATNSNLAVFVYKKPGDSRSMHFTEFSPAPTSTKGYFGSKSQATTSEIILLMTLGGNKTPFSFVVTDRSAKAGLTSYVQELKSKLEARNMGTAFCICGGFSSGQEVNASKQELNLDEDDSFLKSTLPEYRVQISGEKGEQLKNSSTSPAETPDRIVFCMTNSHEMLINVTHRESGVVKCRDPSTCAAGAGSKHYAVFERFTLGFAKWGDGNRTKQQDAHKGDFSGFQSWSANPSAEPSLQTDSNPVPSFAQNPLHRAQSLPANARFMDGRRILKEGQFEEEAKRILANKEASDSGRSPKWQYVRVPGLPNLHATRIHDNT